MPLREDMIHRCCGIAQGMEGHSQPSAPSETRAASVSRCDRQSMGGDQDGVDAAGTVDFRDLVADGDRRRTWTAWQGALVVNVDTGRCDARREAFGGRYPGWLPSNAHRPAQGGLSHLCQAAVESLPARLCRSVLARTANAHAKAAQQGTQGVRRVAATWRPTEDIRHVALQFSRAASSAWAVAHRF